MTRYRVNRYGEVFAEPTPQPARGSTSAGSRQRRPPRSGSSLWSRHWAWFQRRGPWGKTLTIGLIWPSALAICAAAAAVGVASAIVIGAVYGIVVLIRR